MKGLIEFGCSGQEAIRRRHKWSRGWKGCHLATQEQGVLARISGNPPPTVTCLEELQQGPGWVAQGCEPPRCPQRFSPDLLLLCDQGETTRIQEVGATGWFLSPGNFVSKGSMAIAMDGKDQGVCRDLCLCGHSPRSCVLLSFETGCVKEVGEVSAQQPCPPTGPAFLPENRRFAKIPNAV